MSEQATKQQWVVLGRVSGLFGVKGWVKVFSHTDPPGNILDYSPWYLQLDGQWQSVDLLQGKVHGKGIIAHLENCPDRDAAQRLVGVDIAIERSRLPKPAEDEYYWADLVGLQVINKAGLELGCVDHLLETGANDVLVIHSENKQEHLIPYVRGEVVQEIDLDKGLIQVDWDLED